MNKNNVEAVSVGLTPALIKQAKQYAPREGRSFSGLVREALRAYMLPTDFPTADELTAIHAGLDDLRAGRVSLYEPKG